MEIKNFIRSIPLASSTSSLYAHYLSEFNAYLVARGISPEDAGAGLVFDWLDLHTWSSSTRHSAVTALRRYYAWRYGQLHPVLSVRVHTVKSAPQRSLRRQELEALLAGMATWTPKGIRDLAIVALMADTGLRAREVASADLRYLDLDAGQTDDGLPYGLLQVRIKGGSWGWAAFYQYTQACLRSWMAIRPEYARHPTALFVGIGGLTPGRPMTGDGLRTVFYRFTERILGERISPHAMRRTFATLSSKAGAPTRQVQESGRWQDVRQVQRYTRDLAPEDLAPWSPINRVMGLH
ncbi:MAG: tyrosine-type recombinase/integrase [Anaerolineaceae bacterium]|nr:tyrosine-type recombinase/integrase [Anaerolineaceae bacterium]